jgi:hypothetical protein
MLDDLLVEVVESLLDNASVETLDDVLVDVLEATIDD